MTEFTFYDNITNQAVEICYIVYVALHEYTTVCMRIKLYLLINLNLYIELCDNKLFILYLI